jgi:8-hydroxy-5-deazaflavin:NADPH oxidoreductase
MGKAEAARAIEPLCILWCIPGFLHNDWFHAFKLLK